jgi:hypothetical protein
MWMIDKAKTPTPTGWAQCWPILRLVFAGCVAAPLLAVDLTAGAAGLSAKPVISASAPAPAASTVSTGTAQAPRVSPYLVAARQHMQAASTPASPAAVPLSMRRSRQPIGQHAGSATGTGGGS